jgi:hypothetical protein
MGQPASDYAAIYAMPRKRRWIPESEYRKVRASKKKMQREYFAKQQEEKGERDLAWREQGRKLTEAQKEHPVAYFLGTTDTQQKIFGRVSVMSRLFGVGRVNEANPTGHMGFFVSLFLLVLFFPLLLLSHIRQLPLLQIIAFVVFGIEGIRYSKGNAGNNEWKVCLAVLTIIGWTVFLFADGLL